MKVEEVPDIFPSAVMLTHGDRSRASSQEIRPTLPASLSHSCRTAHAKLYHSSKSWFSTLGHLPVESHLEFIDSSLVEFSQIEPSVGEPHEPRWKKPVATLI
ncbi:hypothetical protein RRG08_048486 [Elysia crispata]|uniref:Uncharacterized protein n=1 Tax=Elysia crispata TaxID=231223 RepID=A0AAE1D5A3_9GAST|nr:hypothetical protein RRG08_048486 [Elysia crispata]